MPAVANLVHQSSTSTGTGSFTLDAVNGKQSFAQAFGVGATPNTFDYFISSQDAPQWERGTGHMSSATTLVRDTVLEGTNGTNPVNFSDGAKDIINDIPAGKQVNRDGLASVAFSGDYGDLSGKPTLGTAASHDATDFATAAQGAKADTALQSTDLAPTVHAATGKATPVDADELALVDSEASNVLKKLTWADFKAAVKTYYDAVASTLTNKTLDTAGTGNVLKINGTQISDKTGTGKVVLDTSPTITDGAIISKSAASPLADLKISTTATGSGETHVSRFSGQDSTAGGGFIRALFFAAGPLNGGVNDQGQFDVLSESGTIFLFSITSLAGDNGSVFKLYDRSNVIRILLKADPASVSYVSGGLVVGGSTGNGAGNFRSLGSIGTAAPVTVTASTRTVGANESAIIFNTSATHTLTLPSASSNPGRFLFVKTIAAFAINSASSNVCPISSATPGTNILAATAGKWATLQSDGTNWIIMAAN